MDTCIKHPHEIGVGSCGRCGGAWCGDCLVRPFGDRKPPLCLSCAMFAAGVRSTADRPAASRRELKALAKTAKAEAKAAAKAARKAPAPEPEQVAAFGEAAAPAPTTSWDQPWWESNQPTLAD